MSNAERVPGINKTSIQSVKKWNEYTWPIASLIVNVRPLNHLYMNRRGRIETGQKVLEIGSGYPLWKLYSYKVGDDGLFVAVDNNHNIQRRSKKMGGFIDRFVRRKSKTESIITTDATKLPFSDNSFDTIIAANFNGGTALALEEAYRVLRKGGHLLTSFAEPYLFKEMAKKRADLCRSIGFTDVVIKWGPPASIIPGLGFNRYVEATKPV